MQCMLKIEFDHKRENGYHIQLAHSNNKKSSCSRSSKLMIMVLHINDKHFSACVEVKPTGQKYTRKFNKWPEPLGHCFKSTSELQVSKNMKTKYQVMSTKLRIQLCPAACPIQKTVIHWHFTNSMNDLERNHQKINSTFCYCVAGTKYAMNNNTSFSSE